MAAPRFEVSGETLRQTGRVAILDAGAQYVDLIRRACLRQGFAADILPLDTPFADIEHLYGGFIVSGGPANSHMEGAPMPDPALWETEKGVLGICYGQQAMALAFGGRVETGSVRQDGVKTTQVNTNHPLFSRTKPAIRALFTHGDFVTQLPEGFTAIGEHQLGDIRVISAMARGNFAAVQFHPEVFDDTPQGYDVFRGFLEHMCGLQPDPEMLHDQAGIECERRRRLIAEQAGERHIIAFASGGIDSTLATIFASQVIDPAKLHVYYFDSGFMRDEDDEVIGMLQGIGINITKYDATEEFEQATYTDEMGVVYGPLIDMTDPQIKRKIIGKKFAELKDKMAASLGLDTGEVMLLQGTNAADRIESGYSLAGGQTTAEIKGHHNLVKEIKDLEAAGLLIEPLADLHKDEIRLLSEYLQLPEEVVWRHPFPGPGNAIRILTYRAGEHRLPDRELQTAIRNHVWEASPEAFGVWLLPTRSVGVGGDARSYTSQVALQGPSDWETLAALAGQENTGLPHIFKDQINRVLYALGDNSLVNMSLTETSLGRTERAQLRHADRIVFEEMRRFGLLKVISQLPVILLPLSCDQPGERSIVLRPVVSSTFMTARAVVPMRDVSEEFIDVLGSRILAEVPGISQVFLELTNKPPATIEWE